MSVHRFVLALPLCLSACGIVFDDSSGNSASDSDDSNSSVPHSSEPPGTSDDGGSSGAGSTGDDDGSSGEPATGSTSPTTGEPTTGDAASTGDGGSTGDTGAVNQVPPLGDAEVLEKWLSEGSYKGWLSESKVHMSTGPHGGNVRTYINDDLYVSLSNMSPMHPEGAATVKELYGDSIDEIVGYAVMVKVAPDSMGGDGWYWYERLNATTYADGTGVGLCSGCHVGGADYVLTPFPLQ